MKNIQGNPRVVNNRMMTYESGTFAAIRRDCRNGHQNAEYRQSTKTKTTTTTNQNIKIYRGTHLAGGASTDNLQHPRCRIDVITDRNGVGDGLHTKNQSIARGSSRGVREGAEGGSEKPPQSRDIGGVTKQNLFELLAHKKTEKEAPCGPFKAHVETPTAVASAPGRGRVFRVMHMFGISRGADTLSATSREKQQQG